MTESRAGLSPDRHELGLRRDALTMALYVALCLLGALSLLDGSLGGDRLQIVATIWGITIGLVLAHLFAFVASAHVVGSGRLHPHDREAALAHLAGGTAVAVLATVAVLLVPDAAELFIVRLVLSVFIGSVGYLMRRAVGASRPRAFLFALVLMAGAALIAQVKVNLSH
ncbi:hypothetical protein [Intrasporangium oryzae]|uniref:hypothetical protein n=1 Tax=Intrasporangium oryzae TaxID=412687 RepID=UPI0004BA48CF|nr:hypothetical protein [Intrasporangium oryzae]